MLGETDFCAIGSETHPLVFGARKDVFLKSLGEEVGSLADIHVSRTEVKAVISSRCYVLSF